MNRGCRDSFHRARLLQRGCNYNYLGLAPLRQDSQVDNTSSLVTPNKCFIWARRSGCPEEIAKQQRMHICWFPQSLQLLSLSDSLPQTTHLAIFFSYHWYEIAVGSINRTPTTASNGNVVNYAVFLCFATFIASMHTNKAKNKRTSDIIPKSQLFALKKPIP